MLIFVFLMICWKCWVDYTYRLVKVIRYIQSFQELETTLGLNWALLWMCHIVMIYLALTHFISIKVLMRCCILLFDLSFINIIYTFDIPSSSNWIFPPKIIVMDGEMLWANEYTFYTLELSLSGITNMLIFIFELYIVLNIYATGFRNIMLNLYVLALESDTGVCWWITN